MPPSALDLGSIFQFGVTTLTLEGALIAAVITLAGVIVAQERAKVKLTDRLFDLSTRMVESNIALKGAVDLLRESLKRE